ncbi:hypothetical protein [Aeromonas veronii]|uniref:hypothetical protein n=1 Tax=Aeromonas veronii TaxID=654 RepID=UPI0039F6AA10
MTKPTETQAQRGPRANGVQNVVQMAPFTKFSDLKSLGTIVIHTGHQADPNAENREIWQRTNNVSIQSADPITGEQEPVQSLYVSNKQLEEGGKLYLNRPGFSRHFRAARNIAFHTLLAIAHC